MKVNVLNQTGIKLEELSLNENVFGVTPHEQAIFDAVQVSNSNLRQGTACTKTRAEVRGGGRKPWKQKGTGRARQGSIRSPQWRGGGIAFGPNAEQNYSIKQNRKEARLALKSALSIKYNEGSLIVVDSIKSEVGKTKEMLKILEDLKAKGKTLFVVSEDTTTYETILSLNNLGNVAMVFADKIEYEGEDGEIKTYFDLGINVYDLLNSDTVVMTVEALKNIQEELA